MWTHIKSREKKFEKRGTTLRDYTFTVNVLQMIPIAQDYDGISYLTVNLTEENAKWGSDIHLNKSKYMCIGWKQQDLNSWDNTETMQKYNRHLQKCLKYIQNTLTYVSFSNNGEED